MYLCKKLMSILSSSKNSRVFLHAMRSSWEDEEAGMALMPSAMLLVSVITHVVGVRFMCFGIHLWRSDFRS